MTSNLLNKVLLLFVLVGIMSFDIPAGWIVAGSKPDSYHMGIDKGSGKEGGNAATIQSSRRHITGFGTLMQQVDPKDYLGKRIRMSAWVKSEKVNQWAGLWLRVDQAGSHVPLSFDNMYQRAIKGTTDWKQYDIILDVPTNASNIAFGALLNGTGKIWFDQFAFDIVGNDIPTTDYKAKQENIQKVPTNLNFDH